MSRSQALQFPWQALLGSAASALFLCSFGLATPASAGAIALCPNQATVGGFGETSSDVSGGSCGANSAVQINIPASTDYGKLQFNSGMSGYPAGLTLGGLESLSANVSFTSGGSDQPYFMLDFTDSSDSLGQASAGDQILMIEFQSSTLSGNTLAADTTSTLFNLYDNTTGTYLQGGQSDAKSVSAWLAEYSALGSETLDGVWIGEGLAGSNTGADSLTVNSLTVNTVPEPSSIALLCAGLAMLGFMGFGPRKRTGST
jgi:PEP-CTERM motif